MHTGLNSLIPPPPGPWRADALCAQVDGDIFFPPKNGSPGPAKMVCGQCPVIGECRLYALTNRLQDGVWGGLTPRERARVLSGKAKLPPVVPVKQPTIPVLYLAKLKPAEPSPLPPAKPVRHAEPEHGTYQGHSWHVRNRDKPCDPCRLAKNAYVRAHNKATKERKNA